MIKYKQNKEQQGFTMIELMIVVAIVGILAAIAYPSFVDQIRKGKRADAKVELLRIAQLQESFFVQNLSYAKSLAVEAGGLGLGASVQSEQEEYDITVVAQDSDGGGCTGTTADACVSFTLTATPNGSQASDAQCMNFTLTNTGRKDVSVSGNGLRCWK